MPKTEKERLVEEVIEQLKPSAYVEKHNCWKFIANGLHKMSKNELYWLQSLLLTKREKLPKDLIRLECSNTSQNDKWVVSYNKEIAAYITYRPHMTLRSYHVEYMPILRSKMGNNSQTYESFYSAWIAINKKVATHKKFKALRD